MTYEEKVAQAKQILEESVEQLAFYAIFDSSAKLIEHAARLREVRQQYLDAVAAKPKIKLCGSLSKTCSGLGVNRTCKFAGECVFQFNKI